MDRNNDRRRRRFDGFLPSDVANLAVWTRADQGINAVGGLVEFWDFFNGTFRGVFRLGQGAGANRPTHIVSDPVYNNRSTVSFGGNDFLDTPNFSANIIQPNTIFIVSNFGVAAIEIMFFETGGAQRNALFKSGGNISINANVSLNTPFIDTNPHIYEGTYDGVNSELFIDGTSLVIGDAGILSLANIRFGANSAPANFLTGKIAEFIVYNADVSAADRTDIRNYLNTRYAIF
ncbi:hypothetical protein LCGC14_0463630 [marine sediment metagenome]|uniref:Uncharacterized protein n=1 Tax=marine sediment metagenome TaxID=412755 RepID=A0A0F9SE88_9ZZZZ